MNRSVMPSFSKTIMHYLDQLGVEVDKALQAQISQYGNDQRLPMALQDSLWQALEAHGDAELGLNIGLAFNPQSFDTLGFLLLSSPSIGAAVDSLIGYSPLIGEGGTFSKSHSSQGWHLSYKPDFCCAAALRMEAILSCVTTGAGWVAGQNIQPLEVGFAHAAMADEQAYRRVFGGAKLVFNASHYYLLYSDEDWHCKQREVSPALLAQMQELAKQQLAQLKPQSVVEQVNYLLARQPWLSRAQVAGSLAMSERHLSRKLADADSTFKALSEQVKKRRALELISAQNISQSSIADMLGYADENAFAKAFKRWTGMGFREYKQQSPP
ncbi:AraC family transcriptional regulator [Pseudoalteromonas sp. GB56]